MRKLFVFIVISAMTLDFMSTLIIKADYIINFDYISEVLCINQDKPELECHGQCHVTKEIQKDNERKSQKIENENEEVLFVRTDFFFEFPPILKKINPRNLKTYQFIICESDQSEIFHPPLV